MLETTNSLWASVGFRLGGQVESDYALKAVVTALLMVLGKDQADGIIDLGAAGRWYPGGTEGARKVDGP